MIKKIMFKAWKTEDFLNHVIKIQGRFIKVLVVISLCLIVGWMSAPSRIRIFIPPDLSSGATVKADQILASTAYNFAYVVWQEVNTWRNTGEADYKNNLGAYQYYLTKQFLSDLEEDQNELESSGQLDRIRYMTGLSGAAFDPSFVKALSNNSWEVDLTMRVTEYKNNQIVKDVEILYPLKITRSDVAQSMNPYGLVLAGFASEPQRIKTYV